jgi:hypothetical protein
MFLINLMISKNLQKGFDEDLITKIMMELIVLFFCIDVAFYVIKIYYCSKIIDMHV